MLIQGSNVFIKQAQQLSCPVKVKPEVVKPEDKESPTKSDGGDSNGRDGKGGKAKSVCTVMERFIKKQEGDTKLLREPYLNLFIM